MPYADTTIASVRKYICVSRERSLDPSDLEMFAETENNMNTPPQKNKNLHTINTVPKV